MTTASQEFTSAWTLIASAVTHVGVKVDRGSMLVSMGTVIPAVDTVVGLTLLNEKGEDEFVCDDMTGQTLWGRAVGTNDSATATVIKW